MNGSFGAFVPSSLPSSLSSAVESPEAERRCALFSVGDEHAASSRAASPAPIAALRSTLGGSCSPAGLPWSSEPWSVVMSVSPLSAVEAAYRFRGTFQIETFRRISSALLYKTATSRRSSKEDGVHL